VYRTLVGLRHCIALSRAAAAAVASIVSALRSAYSQSVAGSAHRNDQVSPSVGRSVAR